MVNNKVVVTRVSKNQLERIKISAQAKVYKNVSDYLRSLALEKDMAFEKKFDEMYTLLCSLTEDGKKVETSRASKTQSKLVVTD